MDGVSAIGESMRWLGENLWRCFTVAQRFRKEILSGSSLRLSGNSFETDFFAPAPDPEGNLLAHRRV